MIFFAQDIAEYIAAAGMYVDGLAGNVGQPPAERDDSLEGLDGTQTWSVSWGTRLTLFLEDRMCMAPYPDQVFVRLRLRRPNLDPDINTEWTELPVAGVKSTAQLATVVGRALHHHARLLSAAAVSSAADNMTAGLMVRAMLLTLPDPEEPAPPPEHRTVILGEPDGPTNR